MDRQIKNYLEQFITEHQISEKDQSKQFEKFVNFCVVSKEYSDETFDVQDISTGSGGDNGIDGLAIIVNGRLTDSIEMVDDLIELNGYLDATFIMIQAKTTSGFDGAQIRNFGDGVVDFFSETPRFVRNQFIKDKVRISEHILQEAAQVKSELVCKLFYVTTGTWCDDANLIAKIELVKKEIDGLNIFDQSVEFAPAGSKQLQKLYRGSKEKISVAINFEHRVMLPEIDGVKDAYLGFLPVEEFVKLIKDDAGNIRKSVFFDNVRDYQGENPVNLGIKETIEKGKSDQFVVLNNGVTIVAKSLEQLRNQFTLTDYQIVNGCQTSHVIYHTQEFLNAQMRIPVKIICSNMEEVINSIIKATNRQTEVGEEELLALSEFQKDLEVFYQTFKKDRVLYYERRSKQYDTVPGLEKVRIVTKSTQIRTFASMFLDQPHKASRFYGTLAKDIGNSIFKSDHKPVTYYTSAFAMYKIEYLFRNKSIDTNYRKFKYHMLMLLKYAISKENMPKFNSNKIEKYCNDILDVLNDNKKLIAVIQRITKVIDRTVPNLSNTEITKKQSLNKELIENILAPTKK